MRAESSQGPQAIASGMFLEGLGKPHPLSGLPFHSLGLQPERGPRDSVGGLTPGPTQGPALTTGASCLLGHQPPALCSLPPVCISHGYLVLSSAPLTSFLSSADCFCLKLTGHPSLEVLCVGRGGGIRIPQGEKRQGSAHQKKLPGGNMQSGGGTAERVLGGTSSSTFCKPDQALLASWY